MDCILDLSCFLFNQVLGKYMEMLGVTRAYRLCPNTGHVVSSYEIIKSASKPKLTAPSTKSYVLVLPSRIAADSTKYFLLLGFLFSTRIKHHQTALVSSFSIMFHRFPCFSMLGHAFYSAAWFVR